MLKTIKFGSSGNEVRVASLLTGFGDVSAFSELMTTHVKAWQSARKLDADGIIGAKTWAKMASEAATVSVKKPNDKAVKALQCLLNLTVDGIFGSKTKAGVLAYQASAGLVADGVCGPKTWTALLVGTSAATVTNGKVLTDCKTYKQGDPKWSSIMYSNHNNKSQTIGNSGCGPTSCAMVVATWSDASITPVEMCKLAVDTGYRKASGGTDRGFCKYVFEHFKGFSKFVRTSSSTTLFAALQEGALAVCSMNSGDSHFWTTGGHYIVARGIDATYVYANDPAKYSTANPRKQKRAKFSTCLNEAMIFWRAEE